MTKINDPKEENSPYYLPLNVVVSTTLSKELTINVRDYDIVDDFTDESSNIITKPDFSNTDLCKEYERNHWSLHDLLLTLETYIELDLKEKRSLHPKHVLKRMLEDCKNWKVDEFEVIEN